MYQIKISSQDRPLSAVAPYYDQERFLAMCRECPRYETVWSCPPYAFKPEELLADFNRIKIYGRKIIFAPAVLKTHAKKEAAMELAKTALAREKRQADFAVLEQEKARPESLALYGGGCRLCRNCSRIWQRPCRHADLMRPSLESLGYDVGAISENVLGTPLLWFTDRLPAYMMLVTALLYTR